MNQYLEQFHFANSQIIDILIVALVVLALVLRRYMVRIIYGMLLKIFHRPPTKDIKTKTKALRPFDWLFVVMVVHTSLYYRLPKLCLQFEVPIRILYILIIAWAVISIIEVLASMAANSKLHLYHTIQSILMQGLKLLAVVVAMTLIISELGYDMNGLLAGLGLGGLAIALAAQEVLSNVIGCFVIVFDQPFSLNDWIEAGEIEGIVEEISFRSTRIRTFDHALVSVPNSKLTQDVVINWSKMRTRKLQVFVPIQYDTSKEQLDACLMELRKTIQTHPSTTNDAVRIYLDEFQVYGLLLRVECYVVNQGYDAYLRTKEELLGMVLEGIRHHQISFVSVRYASDGKQPWADH